MNRFASRPAPFVLGSTAHGPLILNVHDHRQYAEGPWGVGYALLTQGHFDGAEVERLVTLATMRRNHFGDGVVFLDVGANIGVMTVELARHMTGWGSVIAYEAQERVFYALAGNICINNCFNAQARLAGVGRASGTIAVPQPDYTRPGNFGALELVAGSDNADMGQLVTGVSPTTRTVPLIALDAEHFERVDLVKIDVEKMEPDVLTGALELIGRYHPVFHIETKKTDRAIVDSLLDGHGYDRYLLGNDTLYVHGADPVNADVMANGWKPANRL